MKYFEKVSELIERMNAEDETRIAYRFLEKGKIVDITYKTLSEQIERVAKRLHTTIGERNTIAIYGDTSYQWMVDYLGILLSNNIVVTMDPKLMLEQKRDIFLEMGVEYIFHDKQQKDENQYIYENCKQIKDIYEIKDYVHKTKNESVGFQLEYDNNGLAQYMFTSGSTGKSKVAMFSYKNIASMMQIEVGEFIKKQDIVLSLLPLHHCLELSCQLSELAFGATICINDSKENMMNNFKLFEPTSTNVVPAILEEILRNFQLWKKEEGIDVDGVGMNDDERKRFRDKFGSRLERIHSGGAAARPDAAKIADYFEIKLLSGLGMTEMFGHCCNNSRMLEKPKSVGVPFLKAIDIKLTEDGEILIKGPQLMIGYYKMERSEFFSEDGYYKTGDLGRFDEDGFLYIVGRKKNIILLGNGENVYPEELESLLYRIKEVKETVVFEWENQIAALIYMESMEEEQLIKEQVHDLNKNLAAYKRITNVFCTTKPFPRTAASKLDKQTLLKEFRETHKRENISLHTEKEHFIAEIIKDVLTCEREIYASDNFFALGGNSLLALAVAAKANINAQCLYEYPVISDLAKALEVDETESIVDESYVNDFITNTKEIGKKGNLNHILLTGTSGYFGAHVLYDMMKKGVSNITCLVRSESKLREVYRAYFNEELPEQISVVVGDISKKNVGMDSNTYQELADRIDTVEHIAANVNHLGDKEAFMKTNYIGTKYMIQLCKDAGAEFHYVSSYVSSGIPVVPIHSEVKEFTEQVLFIGQEYKKNIYVHTKYLSEVEILKERIKGLNANIYRVGCLTNRKKDGVFQLNGTENGLKNRLRGFLKIGILPELMAHMPIDLTAVDECADAFVCLILSDNMNQIYHLFNPNTTTMYEIGMIYGKENSVVSGEEFDQIIRKHLDDKEIAEYGFYSAMTASSKAIEMKCEETVLTLKKLGFVWEKNSENYIRHFVD